MLQSIYNHSGENKMKIRMARPDTLRYHGCFRAWDRTSDSTQVKKERYPGTMTVQET